MQPRHVLWIVARSILVGWAALVAIAYLVIHPLLTATSRWLGAHWLPTARVALDCLVLAAIGWVIGRLHRSAPMLGVLAFAVTLTVHDLDPLLVVNVPWLIRLAMDTLHDSLYLESLVAEVLQDVLLFGSLFAGAVLSRAPQKPISIVGSAPE